MHVRFRRDAVGNGWQQARGRPAPRPRDASGRRRRLPARPCGGARLRGGEPDRRHERRRRGAAGLRRLRAAGPRPADRAGLRVRERVPRYRQRGRHGDLHALDAAAGGGDLVGLLQLPRRDALLGRRGLRHRHAAAGGADPERRFGCGLRDDLRAAARGDPLESRDLGLRPAELLVARADRLGARRRPRQPADERRRRHRGRRLGQALNVFKALLFSPVCGFVARRAAAARAEIRGAPQGPLRGAQGRGAPAPVDPRPADPDLHAGLVLPRRQ